MKTGLMNKEEVLNILKGEFDSIQKLKTSSSYGLWGLTTAFVATLWTLLNLSVLHGIPALGSVALLVLIEMLMVDALANFFRWLFSYNRIIPQVFRLTAPYDNYFRLKIVCWLIWSAVPLALLFGLHVTLAVRILVSLYYGFIFLIGLMFLGLECFAIAFTGTQAFMFTLQRQNVRFKWVTDMTWWVIEFLPFISLVMILWRVPLTNPYILQVSLLCVALLLLATNWLRQFYSMTDDLMNALEDLRRKLVFNRIDTETAFQEAEVMIHGKKLNQGLQTEIQDIMILYDGIHIRTLQYTQNLQKAGESEQLSIEARDELDEILDEMIELSERLKLKTDHLTRKLMIVSTLNIVLVPEVLEITNCLGTRKDKMIQETREMRQVSSELKKKYLLGREDKK